MRRESPWLAIAKNHTRTWFSNHATRHGRALTTSREAGARSLINRGRFDEKTGNTGSRRLPWLRRTRVNFPELIGGALTSLLVTITTTTRESQRTTRVIPRRRAARCMESQSVERRRGNGRWMVVENGDRQWSIGVLPERSSFLYAHCLTNGAGSSLAGPPWTRESSLPRLPANRDFPNDRIKNVDNCSSLCEPLAREPIVCCYAAATVLFEMEASIFADGLESIHPPRYRVTDHLATYYCSEWDV